MASLLSKTLDKMVFDGKGADVAFIVEGKKVHAIKGKRLLMFNCCLIKLTS